MTTRRFVHDIKHTTVKRKNRLRKTENTRNTQLRKLSKTTDKV